MRPVTLIEAFYKGVQVFMAKLGDFLREIAALVLVFIPLDLWKDSLTWQRGMDVVLLSLFLFLVGVACECVAIAVKRGRDRYEEAKSYEPA